MQTCSRYLQRRRGSRRIPNPLLPIDGARRNRLGHGHAITFFEGIGTRSDFRTRANFVNEGDVPDPECRAHFEGRRPMNAFVVDVRAVS